MAKSIYIMKMTLLLYQIPLHLQKKKKVQKMALFVVFVYLRSWFTAPALVSAASNDINLFRSLQKFKSVDSKVSTITTAVLIRYTWYLTEELIPLSLFNEDLPLSERTLLATKIGQISYAETKIRNPTLPVINEKSELSDFVGETSNVLFKLLEIPVTFLQNSDWHLMSNYDRQPYYTVGALGHLGHCFGALGALVWGTWGTRLGHLGHSSGALEEIF